jgi:Fe-S oxidoreductase
MAEETSPKEISPKETSPKETGSKAINSQEIMDFLKPRVGARFKTWLDICAHCALCADTCHFYLTSDKDPNMIPARKVRFLKEILKKKGKVDKAYLDEVYHTIYHECNMCRRCTMYCPFGIDIALMISLLRATLTTQGMVPEGLRRAIENYKATGNQMAVTKDEWVDTIQWCEEEASAEVVGLKIPIDKKGAKLLYTVNAREPKFYPQDIMEVAKIFHVAGEDWTLPSESGWDDTNLAMFAGDIKTAKTIVENTFKRAEELEVKQVAITE